MDVNGVDGQLRAGCHIFFGNEIAVDLFVHKEKPSSPKDLSLPHGISRDERKKAATNGDQTTPEREKGLAFSVGSGRRRYWQRPLPIMAAGGKNNGSARCLPC